MRESNKYAEIVPQSEFDSRVEIYNRFNTLPLSSKGQVIAKLATQFETDKKLYSHARAVDNKYPIELRANNINSWDDGGYKSIVLYEDQIDDVIQELMDLKASLF